MKVNQSGAPARRGPKSELCWWDSFSVSQQQWAVGSLGIICLVAFWPTVICAQVPQITQVNPATTSSVLPGSGLVVVRWTGGTAPFQVQCRAGVSGNWVDIDSITYGNSQTNILTQASAYYRVASVTNSISASRDHTAPSVPTGLSASVVNCAQVNLSWNASTDSGSNATGVKGYNLYRNGIFVTQVLAPATSASDTNLRPSTNYSYSVCAVDNAYNSSAKCSAVSVTTPSCSVPPPTVPTGLATTLTSCTNVVLTWNASTDTGGPGLAGYKIYKNGSLLLQESGIGLIDNTLAAVSSYTYAISAVDTAGRESAQCSPISVNTPSCPVGCTYSISPSSISFASAATNGSVNVTAGGGCTWAASTTYSWIHTTSSGSGNGTANYTVDANTTTTSRQGTITIAARTFTVNQAGDTTPPTVSLTAPANGSTVSSTIALSATATDNSGGSGMARVEFYCDNVTTPIATATTAPYNGTCDTTTMPNGSHNFYAKAYDVAGNSTNSASVSVTVNNSTPGQLQWLKTTAYDAVARVNSIVNDHTGNVIIVGLFSGTVDFGGTSVTSAGGTDIFIAKYSPQGSLSWVKRFGNIMDDVAYGVAVDSHDNILVTGGFSMTVDFGGGSLTSTGGKDIFVAKYSPSGAYVWAKGYGGTSDDYGQAIAVDPSDNVVFTGYGFGPLTFGGTTLTGYGAYDMVLAKLAGSTGATTWAEMLGSTGYDYGQGLAVDRSGNVMLTGQFGGGSLSGLGGSGSASAGALIAKYSGSTGASIWMKVVAGSNAGYGAACDTNGNVYVTGSFQGSADFGGGSITTMNSGGIFLAAYGSSGNYLWARGYGGYGDAGCAVALDGNGNLAVTGKCGWGADFSGTGIYTVGSGFFVASFTTNATYRWSKRTGSGVGGSGNGLAFDGQGHVITCGYFNGTADFGGISATADMAPSLYSAFIAQYGQ